MNDLTDAYPEMYLATVQDRISRIELSRRRAQWDAERKRSRRGRRRHTWRVGLHVLPRRGRG